MTSEEQSKKSLVLASAAAHPPRTPRLSAADVIRQRMRSEILSGELEGGERYSIYQLAERYGVSRTPVRDAALRLADVGLLEIERNRGIRVRGTRVSDVREVFELRLALEPSAAGRAAVGVRSGAAGLVAPLGNQLETLRRMAAVGDADAFAAEDRTLHRLILAASDNPRLIRMIDELRDGIQAHGVTTMMRTRSLAEVCAEHEPIVTAILAGDPVAAEREMRDHLVSTGGLLMWQVAETTGEDTPVSWEPTDW